MTTTTRSELTYAPSPRVTAGGPLVLTCACGGSTFEFLGFRDGHHLVRCLTCDEQFAPGDALAAPRAP